MSSSKIVDRSAVEILLDHGRADVRRPCYCRGIAEPLAHGAHRRGDHALGLCFGLGDSVLRKRDRGEQRAAPGAEILGRELVADMPLDVLVQAAPAERAQAVAVSIAKEASAALRGQELAHRIRKLRVDESRSNQGAALAVKAECDAAPP